MSLPDGWRVFTKSDWMGYSGCESESPLMFNHEILVYWNQVEYSCDLILDNNLLCFNGFNDDAENDVEEMFFSKYFDSADEAIKFISDYFDGNEYEITAGELTDKGFFN
jgi:hypothetical protein